MTSGFNIQTGLSNTLLKYALYEILCYEILVKFAKFNEDYDCAITNIIKKVKNSITEDVSKYS